MRVPPDLTADAADALAPKVREVAEAERAELRAASARGALLLLAAVVLTGVTAGLAAAWFAAPRAGWQLWAPFAVLASAALLLAAAVVAAAVAAARSRAGARGDLCGHLAELGGERSPAARIELLVGETEVVHRARRGAGRAATTAATLLGAGAVALAALAVLLPLAAREPAASDGGGRTTTSASRLDRLARTYAPLVHLHPEEARGPLDPARFVAGSALRWRRPGRDPVVARRGRLRPGQLGAGCGATCLAYGPFTAPLLTRPGAAGNRPRGVPRSRGLYLDADDRLRRGLVLAQPPVPAFYEAADDRLTYWLFFGASTAGGTVREGDWERVEVELRDGRPAGIRFPGTGAPRVAWDALALPDGDTHPVLYAARGVHALWHQQRRACAACTSAPRDDGPAWRTWQAPGGLRPVRAEPWFGFGGAWGHAPAGSRPAGPLGPR